MEKVIPIKVSKDMKVKDLVDAMAKTGFGARKIGLAAKIAEEMFSDKECKVFLGVAGAMVPGGMKQLIIDLINKKYINVLVTTGANLTHDLAESLGHNHYHCDTWNDEKFNKEGYDRIYNVLMKNDVYGDLENFFSLNWDLFKDITKIKDLLSKIGELLPDNSNSILKACYKNNVPIYCPSLADSGIGLMIWGRLAAGKTIKVGAFEDMNDIIDFSWVSKRKGVIYIGGGVPKNFIQQSLQFSTAANYGIQITTDSPAGGGSSGAPLVEGKSWGKLEHDAEYVDVLCDATIALPLIFSRFL
jgi:deoxyhypusine synthase